MNTLRRLFLIILIGWISPNLFGQGWERAYPGVPSGASGTPGIVRALPLPGGTFLLLINVNPSGPTDFIKITTIDADGKPLASTELSYPYQVTAIDLLATSDGGYALLYQESVPTADPAAKLLKLDAQLNTLFERELKLLDPGYRLQAQQLVESSAGICIVGLKGQTPYGQAFLACYSLSGTVLNYTTWGPNRMYTTNSACRTNDGGVLAVGANYDAITYKVLGIVAARFNPDGTQLLWEQALYKPLNNRFPSAVNSAPDGGYLIAGSEYSKGYLAKLDELGNLLWEKNFSNLPALPNSLNTFSGFTPTADGTGYWAFCPTSKDRPLAVRLDLQGTIVSYHYLSLHLESTFGRLPLALPDGGCLATGFRILNKLFPYAVRLDSLGHTFSSGIAGSATGDTDNDCQPDQASQLQGLEIQAFDNGQLTNTTTIGAQGNYFLPLDTGVYQVALKSPGILWSFCPDTLTAAVSTQDTTSGVDFTGFYNAQLVDSIFGYVYEDYDGDCIKDDFEPGYANWHVSVLTYWMGITNPEITTTTDSNGYFLITDLDSMTNDYGGLIGIYPPSNDGLFCNATCVQNPTIIFGDSTSFQMLLGMHCDSLPPCPVLDVSIASYTLRPCQESKVQVRYNNSGAVTAEQVELTITVDPALQVLGSSKPWSAVNGNVYTFPLGNVLAEDYGTFDMRVQTPCNTPLGTTYCFEAHIFPDTLCQDTVWNGPEINVSAACVGDSVVFTLQNIGAEDMSNTLEYIVIEDNVLLMQVPGQFQLDAGESLLLSFPAMGNFFRLETEQIAGFPGLSTPVAWIEGCNNTGGTVSLGFVNQYPLPDEEPWLDIFCLDVVNSCDPNDKTGYPLGFGPQHLLEENTDLEYVIRFQNTGTAPALEIEIRDTIPVQLLNPLTVSPGASSHAYTWDMQGNGVVVFRFPGINLPDSASSPDLSQGFVKFRVSQQADLPSGTVIPNTAAIYFDNNAPVITNQTWHTIGQDFILLVGTQQVFAPLVQVQLAPNPVSERVRIKATGLRPQAEPRFRLLNQLGQPILEHNSTGPTFDVDASRLAPGVYFYELWENNGLVATGKLVKLGR